MSKVFKKPKLVAIDVTYKCNLKCLHCFNFSGDEETTNFIKSEISDDELLKLTDSIIEIEPDTVCLCGGEPILRGDIIFELISKIITETQGRTNVNIVTNGQSITKEKALKLKKSGLNFIQVSLDGSDAESCDWIRNKKGAYEKICNAIKILVDAGLEVSVACCPTKKNLNKIVETMELAENLGVHLFRMQPLMNLGRAQKYLKEHMLDFIEYKKVVEIFEEYRYRNSKMDLEWGDPISHLTEIAVNDKEYFSSFTINAYGDILISPYIPITFGNIKNHTLNEYWEGGLRTVHRTPFLKEVCKKIKTANNMDISKIENGLPQNYKDEPLSVDIIDNPENLNLNLKDLIEIN